MVGFAFGLHCLFGFGVGVVVGCCLVLLVIRLVFLLLGFVPDFQI